MEIAWRGMQADGLTFRQTDLRDPAAWTALASLLVDIFGIDITPLERLGGPDPTSMTCGWRTDEIHLAANLSAFTLPMMIDGRQVRAAGLQSGAVRPEFRGRGLFRDVTEKALNWCDEQGFEAVLLYTKSPALYERHGFVGLPQSRFLAHVPTIGTPRSAARQMDLGDPADLTLAQNMLAARQPVSTRFSVGRQSEMFLLNVWLSDDIQLHDLRPVEAIVASRQGEDGVFELLDIVAAEMPALGDILAALGIHPSRVRIDFVPDRLACDFATAPDDDPLVLMMRSREIAIPKEPIRLPELAHF